MNNTIDQQVKQRSVPKKRTVNLLSRGLLCIACLTSISAVSPGVAARTSEGIHSGFMLPFSNFRVTSRFHQGRWHPGIDLAAPTGTVVRATTSGQKVTFAGWRGGYGKTVITRDAQGRTHLYAHLQSITAKVGQVLNQGRALGAVGSTGFSTGPHLHYELRNVAGRHVDPAPMLFSRRAMQSGPPRS
jgi:murein DD-endopeptidase MepM/ murein hydrolase activator NlpD